MSHMKRLYEAIEEAERLSRSEPLDEEGLRSLFQSMHDIALHGNKGFHLLVEALFTPKS